MNEEDRQYGLCFSISDQAAESMGHDMVWKHAKKELAYQLLESVIAPTLGDEQYHVFHSKYFQDRDPMRRATNIYLKLDHSIAQRQEIRIAEITTIPLSAIPICRFCGNELHVDRRGGCSACGGPVGWSKT